MMLFSPASHWQQNPKAMVQEYFHLPQAQDSHRLKAQMPILASLYFLPVLQYRKFRWDSCVVSLVNQLPRAMVRLRDKLQGLLVLWIAVMVTVHPSEKMKPEISHGESYRMESRGNSMPVFSYLVSVSMVLRVPYTVLPPGMLTRGGWSCGTDLSHLVSSSSSGKLIPCGPELPHKPHC